MGSMVAAACLLAVDGYGPTDSGLADVSLSHFSILRPSLEPVFCAPRPVLFVYLPSYLPSFTTLLASQMGELWLQ